MSVKDIGRLPLVKSTKYLDGKRVVAGQIQNIVSPDAPNRGTSAFIPGLGYGFGQATSPAFQTQPPDLQRQQRPNGTISY